MILNILLGFLTLFEVSNGHKIFFKEKFKNNQDCIINLRANKIDQQPLYLIPDKGYWPINGKGQMVILSGEEIEFNCPSTFEIFFGEANRVKAKCLEGTTFNVGQSNYAFTDFKCKSWNRYTARKTNSPCPGGELLQTGYDVKDRFLTQSLICFNETVEATRYVQHYLEPGSDFFQTAVPRNNFIESGFFGGKNVDNLFSQRQQQITISEILGYDASDLFDNKKNLFLARGHLAAKADYITGSQQRATSLFVNTAPQWQSFNAGNWARLEDGVRTMATKRQIYLECYTGTHGVTTLPNVDGVPTELYLHINGDIKQIPVPKIYFRIIYEPISKKAVVLVGVNNPYLSPKQIEDDYIFCDDISERISYINWETENLHKGFSYACEYDDFKKMIPYIPNLKVSGVLD